MPAQGSAEGGDLVGGVVGAERDPQPTGSLGGHDPVGGQHLGYVVVRGEREDGRGGVREIGRRAEGRADLERMGVQRLARR